jgi:uncharacterized membrane protein
MLSKDRGAIDRAVQSAPPSSDGGISKIMPYAGGALGGVVGAFMGNPLLGASLGYKAGGIAGDAIDGNASPDKTVDLILSAKRAKQAASESAAFAGAADTIAGFSPDEAGSLLGGAGG